MENEIWKDVVGFEGSYIVSNYGNVKSVKKDLIITVYPNIHGYLTVPLYRNGKKSSKPVHRLVVLAFYGEAPSEAKFQVNHKDGIKINNRLDNLEYCTRKENMKHASINGLLRNRSRKKS